VVVAPEGNARQAVVAVAVFLTITLGTAAGIAALVFWSDTTTPVGIALQTIDTKTSIKYVPFDTGIANWVALSVGAAATFKGKTKLDNPLLIDIYISITEKNIWFYFLIIFCKWSATILFTTLSFVWGVCVGAERPRIPPEGREATPLRVFTFPYRWIAYFNNLFIYIY
jgi:hypothetical protein